MPNIQSPILCCPLCHQSLAKQQNSWVCPQNHRFDEAKEGYVNLLPVQFKHSKVPGDDPQMVRARRQFLADGHYQPLAEHIQHYIRQHKNNASELLDMGCGEGFYTRALHSVAENVWGVDIAKAAVKKAAKADQEGHYLVASISQLPVADQSLDIITRIFAPLSQDEVDRSLKSDGIFISVVPGARHLWQLREYIYDEVRPHDDTPVTVNGLSCVASYSLRYQMELSEQARRDLMGMTPFTWKLTDAKRKAFLEDETAVEADFTLHMYQRLS